MEEPDADVAPFLTFARESSFGLIERESLDQELQDKLLTHVVPPVIAAQTLTMVSLVITTYMTPTSDEQREIHGSDRYELSCSPPSAIRPKSACSRRGSSAAGVEHLSFSSSWSSQTSFHLPSHDRSTKVCSESWSEGGRHSHWRSPLRARKPRSGQHR